MSKIEFTNNNLTLAGRKFSAEVQGLFKTVVATFGLKESILFVEKVFSAPCNVSLRDFLAELAAKKFKILNGYVSTQNGRAAARPELFTSLTALRSWAERHQAKQVISAKAIANSTVLATKQTLPKPVKPLVSNLRQASFPNQTTVRAYISGFKARNGYSPAVRDIQKRFKEFKGDKASWQSFLKVNNISVSA